MATAQKQKTVEATETTPDTRIFPVRLRFGYCHRQGDMTVRGPATLGLGADEIRRNRHKLELTPEIRAELNLPAPPERKKAATPEQALELARSQSSGNGALLLRLEALEKKVAELEKENQGLRDFRASMKTR